MLITALTNGFFGVSGLGDIPTSRKKPRNTQNKFEKIQRRNLCQVQKSYRAGQTDRLGPPTLCIASEHSSFFGSHLDWTGTVHTIQDDWQMHSPFLRMPCSALSLACVHSLSRQVGVRSEPQGILKCRHSVSPRVLGQRSLRFALHTQFRS